MRLNEIQKKFKDAIIRSDIRSDMNSQSLHHDQDKNQEFLELFETGNIALENRFSVYQNNVLKSLTDVITATYPLIESLTGTEFLRSAARLYIQDNLPQKGNLNDYGGEFSAFLAAFEPAKALPYLPDIARMEWGINEAYYASDDTALAMQALQDIPEDNFEKLSFSLRHSSRLIRSDYPLHKIRDFCLKNDEEAYLNIDSGPVNLLILRPELKVEVLEIPDNEFYFLQNIKQGQTIARAIKNISKNETISDNETNLNLTEILQKHFALGTFSSFEIRT